MPSGWSGWAAGLARAAERLAGRGARLLAGAARRAPAFFFEVAMARLQVAAGGAGLGMDGGM